MKLPRDLFRRHHNDTDNTNTILYVHIRCHHAASPRLYVGGSQHLRSLIFSWGVVQLTPRINLGAFAFRLTPTMNVGAFEGIVAVDVFDHRV